MFCDFKQSTKKVGLKIHPDKTKILSNQSLIRRKEVAINNIKVEILPAREKAKCLGQTITFRQQETATCLDTIKGTRKNDTINSTQNASPHRPNKKKIQKENSDQQERERRRR